jgi:hypothetical protein
MGSVLSSSVTPAQSNATSKSNEEAQTTSGPVVTETVQSAASVQTNTVIQTTNDMAAEPVAPITAKEENPTNIVESSNEETKPEATLERYVEPTGTKVEVAPVDVATNADVVKKTKRKHKKHH